MGLLLLGGDNLQNRAPEKKSGHLCNSYNRKGRLRRALMAKLYLTLLQMAPPSVRVELA